LGTLARPTHKVRPNRPALSYRICQGDCTILSSPSSHATATPRHRLRRPLILFYSSHLGRRHASQLTHPTLLVLPIQLDPPLALSRGHAQPLPKLGFWSVLLCCAPVVCIVVSCHPGGHGGAARAGIAQHGMESCGALCVVMPLMNVDVFNRFSSPWLHGHCSTMPWR
jgi:hypothetical protein